MNIPISKDAAISRRQVLSGAAIVGAGLLLAACGSDSGTASSPTTTASGAGGGSTTTASGPGGGSTTTAGAAMTSTTVQGAGANVDLKVAGLAASLEVLAIGTYKAALTAAGSGALGPVPPAVGEFVTVAMGQHQKHLDAWNAVLTGAGSTAVTAPNATLKPTVDAAFAKVTDVAGAATLALMLEEIAAATYLSAQSVLTNKDAIMLAGSIQIIDAQHAAILHYVLGEYPVPDVFAKVDKAAAA